MRGYAACLIFVVAIAALLFGSPYPWAYWPLAGACAALGVWGIAAARAWRQPSLRGLAAALGVIGAVIALQLVPLPREWLLRLSPAAERFLEQYYFGYAANPPAVHPLSIDPSATAVTLALFFAFAVFWLGATAAVRLLPLAHLAGGLTAVGVALAVIGLVQKAFAPPTGAAIYGFWTTQFGGNPFGPFINRNHFAGWTVMALPIAFAYWCAALDASRHPSRTTAGAWLQWLASPDAGRVGFLLIGILVMGVALVLSGSRSGIASFAVSAGVLAYFVSRGGGSSAIRRVMLGLLLVILGGAILWAGVDAVLARFSVAGQDWPTRLSAWRDAWRVMRDFPIFGTGAGTYMDAMLVYQTGERRAIFFQAHNDYLQILAEGGVLLAVPVAGAIGQLIRIVRRRLAAAADPPLTAWLRRGAIAGLIGIAAQSTVEFSLQLPANAVLFLVLAAIAMHAPGAAHARRV